MRYRSSRVIAMIWILVSILKRCQSEDGGFSFNASTWDITGQDANSDDIVYISCQTNRPKANVSLQIFLTSVGYEDAKKHFGSRITQKDQIFVAKVEPRDSFHYRCLAKYNGYVITLELGNLIVSPVPRFEVPVLDPHLSPLVLEFGASTKIKCMVKGSSNPKITYITWYKLLRGKNETVDNSMIENNKFKRHGITYDAAVLKIKHANHVAGGEYFCIRQYLTYVTATKVVIKIKAFAKPSSRILFPTGPIVVTEYHGIISTICEVLGSPRPKRGWYKNGKLIQECHNRTSQICRLNISSPIYPKDNGTFVCNATNVNGTSLSSISVLVQVPVVLDKPHKEMLLGIDERTHLFCHIQRGNPLPELYWEYQPYDCKVRKVCVPDDNSWKRVLLSTKAKLGSNGMNTSQLVVEESEEDMFYRCVANNTFSQDTYTFAVRRTGTVISAPEKFSASIIAAIVICLTLLVLFTVMFLFWYKKKLKKKYAPYLAPNPNFQYDHSMSLLQQCTRLPYDDDWEFPRARLTLSEILGRGAFGEVWLAEAEGIMEMDPRNKSSFAVKRRNKLKRSLRYSNQRRWSRPRPGSVGDEFSVKTLVAVKTLKDDASESEYKDLASELKILIHLGEHENIVNLLGACTRDRLLCVILEYCPNGNLLNFLRNRRVIFQPIWSKEERSIENECTYVDLLIAAHQVAQGMAFLAAKKCVHRDLAARNILVNDSFNMKIADFGLARDIYEEGFYMKTTGGLLPAKWMPPEALFDKRYTEQSDIWSFGILLWEIFTLGGSPYPGLQTEELFGYLQEGKRMDPPYLCPTKVYALMTDCWEANPCNRPTFNDIVPYLLDILQDNIGDESTYLNLCEEDPFEGNDLETPPKKSANIHDYLKLKNASIDRLDSTELEELSGYNGPHIMRNNEPAYSKLKKPDKRRKLAKEDSNPVFTYNTVGHNGGPRQNRLSTEISFLSDDSYDK